MSRVDIRACATLALIACAGLTSFGAHGENAQEFVYMVEGGMPPMVAIQAATIQAARLLGIEKDYGSIEKGKMADIVAVPGDPLADISLMKKVNFVMRGGTVYKP